jgi:hypothetical protein
VWQQERRRIFATTFPVEDRDAPDLGVTMTNFDLTLHETLPKE